jgi:hypothetical protein
VKLTRRLQRKLFVIENPLKLREDDVGRKFIVSSSGERKEIIMKYTAFGFLTVLALSGLNPALAQDWGGARHNEYRADRQEWKANRDASVGDFSGARRHERHAMRDDFRARRDMNRSFYYRY